MKSLGARAQGLRLERMQASAQWRHGGFRNLAPIRPGLRDPAAKMPTLAEFVCGGTRRVPAAPLPALDPRGHWLQPPASGLRATWIGHSTVLVEIDGARLLTDPVWGRRASPSQLAGPKRFQPAAVPLTALPPLDAVLISHDHYDHLDMATVKRLVRSQSAPFAVPLGIGGHLRRWGVPEHRIIELDWDETCTLGELVLTLTSAHHFSGRGLARNTTLWGSWVIAGP
ncbi:MAG: MBL fold metallo-hydrolase, partial [Burkholderiales bacterium]|nr:MBL fold metallo-hydrolase [Burkholderiales bacterium]